jgi:Leucine-rich repeat (LRR) protein
MQFIESVKSALLADIIPLVIEKTLLNGGVAAIFKLCCVSVAWHSICHGIIVSQHRSKKLVSNRFLRHFCADETLEVLYCDRITSEALESFTNLKSLKTNLALHDETMKWLTGLTSLAAWRHAGLSEVGLALLPNLTHLDLTKLESSAIGNSVLRQLTKLVSLAVPWYQAKITDDGIKDLTGLTSLALHCDRGITDQGIKGLTNITHLDLTGNGNISYNGISKAIFSHMLVLLSQHCFR